MHKNVLVDDLVHISHLLEAEEKGLLLRLPCKIGDTVYLKAYCDCVYVKSEYGAITCPFEDECECEECKDTNERLFKTTVETIFNKGYGWYFTAKHMCVDIPMRDIGRYAFLTEEEAKESEENT